MKLIFVYNAKASLANRTFDFAHKIISPSTYKCDLCTLTHGAIGERSEWTNFRNQSSVEMEFYHIEEFENRYNRKETYPIIFTSINDNLNLVLDCKAINGMNSTQELISALSAKLD